MKKEELFIILEKMANKRAKEKKRFKLFFVCFFFSLALTACVFVCVGFKLIPEHIEKSAFLLLLTCFIFTILSVTVIPVGKISKIDYEKAFERVLTDKKNQCLDSVSYAKILLEEASTQLKFLEEKI